MKKMFHRVLASVFAVCLGLSLSACGGEAETKELNVLTWAEYVPSEVVAEFEEETGVKVNYSNFDTNEQMLSIITNQPGQYDVIICSDYIIDIMVKDGLISELDKSKLQNFGNIDPGYQSKYYDPDNKYTIPYAGAAALLVYDSARTSPVTSYADLWREDLNDSLVLLDGDRDIIGLTLQMMGYSINETDENILNLAKDKLMELRPNVVSFNANTPYDAIINGDAAAGYMFPSQAMAAKEQIETVEFSYPEEGITFFIDSIVLAKDAPNLANAYKFMDYLLKGEVSAKISMTINYPNANSAALEFLSDEFKNNTMVNIPESVKAKAQLMLDVGDAAVIYDRIWTEFKSK